MTSIAYESDVRRGVAIESDGNRSDVTRGDVTRRTYQVRMSAPYSASSKSCANRSLPQPPDESMSPENGDTHAFDNTYEMPVDIVSFQQIPLASSRQADVTDGHRRQRNERANSAVSISENAVDHEMLRRFKPRNKVRLS